ncbi:MAG: Ig-like domain-containing protein, partial [Crenarchaeota archaeon]|nr:Ig-like domain-containing protein [Thermoproteota archaeon]
VTIVAPSQDQFFNTTTVVVEWTYGGSPENFTIYLNGNIIAVVTPPTTSYTLTDLPEGTHNVTIVAKDLAGNTARDYVIFHIDTTPPTVHIDAPLDGAYVRGTVTIQVTWNDANPDECELYVDGILTYTWTTTETVTYDWDTTQVTDGSHTIEVKAYDKAGNIASYSITVIVDNTLPYIHIDAPLDWAYISGIVTIQVLWNDTNPDKCELYIDGTLEYTWTTAGTVTYDWDTTQVTDGSHTIEAKAYDKAGNIASHSITVVVDNIPPTVSIDEPLNGTYVSGITAIQLTWNDTNPSKCELYVDGVLKYTWNETGTVTYNWDTTQVADGSHTIEAKAYDKAGNVASCLITVIVDNTPPTISIISPEPLAWFNKTSVTVKWRATDNGSGISHYEIRIDGGQWIYVGTSTSYTFTNLAEGKHIVEVKAVDNVGFSSVATVTFGIDLTPPLIEILNPSNGSVLSVTKVNVTWKGSDALSGIDHYEIRLDSGSWINVGTSTSYVFENVAPGDHTIYVKAVDRAGNTNIASVMFRIPAPAPIPIQQLVIIIAIFTAIAAVVAALLRRRKAKEEEELATAIEKIIEEV